MKTAKKSEDHYAFNFLKSIPLYSQYTFKAFKYSLGKFIFLITLSHSLAASRHIELPEIQPQPHFSFEIAADMIAYDEGQIDFNIRCKISTINSSSANNWQFSLFLWTTPFLYL